MTRDRGRRARRMPAISLAAVLLAACSPDPSSSPASSSASVPSPLGARPESPAVVRVVTPRSGATVPAGATELEISLRGAELTDITSQDISPDVGHLHVSLDGELVSMTAGLRQTLPDLVPGRHLLRVEFVAADHQPFDPRVVTQAVFEVR